MRRKPTRHYSARRLAQELAQHVRDLGGGQAAALAAFGRLLVPDERALSELVAALPPEVCSVWTEALQRPGTFSFDFDREKLFAEISRVFQPVLPEGHLFELFLRELDRDNRRYRGVYYTPQPLVGFVVRTVARLAEEHFPSQPLHYIDPACGYGGFLVQSRDQWSRTQDNARAPAATMQITGIEICPVTWAAAHLLLASRLQNQPSRLINANPLTLGESLREAILGTPDRPLVPLIVGNPPWSNFGRLNRSAWLSELMADYRAGLSERKANLGDDAIKFICWGQYWIDQADAGILALVTPNTWLRGLTHRRMRESLLASFNDVLVVDLHGESYTPPDDENVFGVRSGVAIVVMVKRPTPRILSRKGVIPEIRHMDLFGSRTEKLASLSDVEFNSARLEPLSAAAPNFCLGHRRPRPQNTQVYASFWPLNRIFRQYISGVQTKNDAVFVAFTREELEVQVRQWLAKQSEAGEFDRQHIRPYLVAPFDRRWIYYAPRLLGRPRLAVMRHLLRPNLGLVFMRQSTCPGQYDHFLGVDCLVSDRVFYSRHGAPFLAPLWLFETEETSHNFAGSFVAAVNASLGRHVQAVELFHYLYAVAYSPAYRQTFAEELRQGFPRLPLPVEAEYFSRMAAVGNELLGLHVGKSHPAAPKDGLNTPLENCEPFRLGGYDVLRRWQSPRQRRGWNGADEPILGWLAAIGRETRRLMQEIDAVGQPWGRPDVYPTETGSSA